MLWCIPPPLDIPRRISIKRRYPDFPSFRRRTELSRGDSNSSQRTLIDSKVSEYDEILLIDAPSPPPKDRKSLLHFLPQLEFESELTEKPPPLPDTKVQPDPAPEPEARPPPELSPKPSSSPEPENDTEPEHPWYRRRLVCSGGTCYPSVFPRSDFSLSTPGAAAAGLNLFGGLDDRAKNDVYSISVCDFAVTRLYTMGDIPSTRFGHGSAFAGSVVVVWGGDTMSASSHQLRARARYDNGLYFLNLASREWTRVFIDGAAPVGRLGHTVVMIGPRVYVFGGHAHGEFFNDIWSFDLSTLISKPAWEQLDPPKGAPRPSRRSGHSCVAYKDQLIMFGGTDGKYHYNDIWAFDTRTRTWSEFWCGGYIPSPREGQSAALVGDIVYIFGGRGVDGANIGELAAFRISNQRWYMFHNMGPEPAPRSGHGMVAVGTKVYVLGGVSEDNLDETGKDANVAYVLDTDMIKYPRARRPLPPTPGPTPNMLSPLR
ncbi:hypothetical protein VTO73DRAFT_616 [Trametes versicolor]